LNPPGVGGLIELLSKNTKISRLRLLAFSVAAWAREVGIGGNYANKNHGGSGDPGFIRLER